MAIEEIGGNGGAESPTNVPPPPAEVKVRTMRSDLDALMKSGGGSPQFRTVSIEGLTLTKTQTEVRSGPPRKGISAAVWGIIVLALAVLGLIIWYGYAVFLHPGK